MKMVRRVHLYLGLVIFPWAIFFGVSGILFNHPNIGDRMERRFVPSTELQALVGISPIDPTHFAHELVQSLSSTIGQTLHLDAEFDSHFVGWSLFQAAAPEGRHVVILNLEKGVAMVATRRAGIGPELAPFSGQTVTIPERTISAIHEKIRGLLPALGKEVRGPVVTNLGAGPQLRFRVRDERGRSYNTSYNMGTRKIEARATDSKASMGFKHTLAELHKTHHFPSEVKPTFFWAWFADVTGLTLVVWGLTGLAMWWQMKKLRRVGVLTLAGGLVAAAPIFLGVIEELTFGVVKRPGGPGPEPPRYDAGN